MNVLILATHLNKGGISRYVINLAKGLNGLGHKVWVSCSGGEWIEELVRLNIKHQIIPIKTKSIFSIKIFFSFLILRKLILKEKIDIVHSNTRVTQYLGFLLYKILNLPYVSAFHGFHRLSFFRRILKFSGVLSIAVSESVKKHLVKDFGFNESRVKVVYNGIDTEDFSSHLLKKNCVEFKDSSFFVGILGRVSEEKGQFLAVEAIKEVSKKFDNIFLLISGKGRLKEALEHFIKEISIESKVKFYDLDANEFLEKVDLLIVPSKKEGFGYSIVEAFIKEVPVIGFNVGGISEIIKDRQNGILFYEYSKTALSKAIEEIISNHTLRQKIVANAKKDIDFYSMKRMADDTEMVYKEIMK